MVRPSMPNSALFEPRMVADLFAASRPRILLIHFREFPAWWIKSCHALIHCVIASFCVVMMIAAGITCSSVMVVFVKSSPFHPPQIKAFAAASKSFCDD